MAEILRGPPILLFDGECVLCSGFVRFVIARERVPVFRFAAVQSVTGQAILRHFGLPLTDWESNVLVEDGIPSFKSGAFFGVLRHLRAPWPWLRGLRVLPLGLRDWLYDRIARNRYALFGRYDRCRLPPAALRARFLA